MKIGFDITPTCIEKKTGIAYYSTNLMKAIYQETDAADINLFCRFSRYKKISYSFSPEFKKVKFYQDPIWPFFKKVDLIHGFDGSMPDWRRVKKYAPSMIFSFSKKWIKK